nr:MAG: hypothetical protein DIU64_01400 [Caldicoprobacter oshimai]
MENKYPFTPVPSRQTAHKMGQPYLSAPQERPSVAAKPTPLAPTNSATRNLPNVPKKIPGFLTPPINPLPLFLLFITIKVLASEIHSGNKGRFSINLWNSISQAVYNPETINMLMAVSPYLDVPEQEGIYTIIGILEAIQVLKGLREGSYQAQRMQQIPVLGLENENKGLGIIKALRDYMPENSRPTIDRAIQIHESIEKLSNNIKIYRNNLKIAGNRKPNPIEELGEIIKVVKSIIPDEQQSKLNKLQKLIQVAQVMDLDEVIKNRNSTLQSRNNDSQKDKFKTEDEVIIDKAMQHKDNIYPREQKSTAHSDDHQTASNNDQNQSLEMLLRLMQLLLQPSNTKTE